jgi:hypothetical protein
VCGFAANLGGTADNIVYSSLIKLCFIKDFLFFIGINKFENGNGGDENGG